MYKIILMEADYEPWWQFEDMEEHFLKEFTFEDESAYIAKATEVLSQFERIYSQCNQKEDRFYAFWNEGEMIYCEGCDEELQKYCGVILSHVINQKVK